MSGTNTQTGNTKQVSITVTRDEYGDWNLQGEAPVDVKLDTSTGTVFIPGGKAVPGTVAKSISENTEVNAKAGESEVGISLLTMTDIDDGIMDLIAQNVTADEFQKIFGDTPGNKTGTGDKSSSDSEALIIETKSDGTIIIPPKDPRIRSFTIRYIHYDGTTREYVLHRTVEGWGNKSDDGCSPKSDGKIVILDPSCTQPDTVIPTPHIPISIPGSGGGGGGGLDDAEPTEAVCQYNPATGQMEIYDPIGDYGLSRKADGSIGVGRDIPSGRNYQEYINSRKGFTGILCSKKDAKPKYPKVPKADVAGPNTRVETIIRTETTWQTHDNSRTVEVMEDSDLIIRIPDHEMRPVTSATLLFYQELKNSVTTPDTGGEEITASVSSTPVSITVERKSGVYVPTEQLPGFVNFNSTSGTFKIPADKIVPNSEVRLSYVTMVKVKEDGGIYGAVVEAGGEMVLFQNTTGFKMDKAGLGDIEKGFVMLPPDLAEYSKHFAILTPRDTGTSIVEVQVFDEQDGLIIKGESVLAPLGSGWITNGDKNGLLSGNAYTGTMLLQRSIFNGKAGKIVATSYDSSRTLSKSVTLEVKNDPEHLDKLKDLPSGLITQPERPLMESVNGTVTIEYLDKDNSWSGEITFVSAETNESLTYSWQRNADWESTFQLVSGAPSARVNKQIRVQKTPNLKFTIPHWLIRNNTEVTATVNGNPQKPEEWSSMSRTVVSEQPKDTEPLTPVLFEFNEETTVFTIKPTGKSFTIDVTYHTPNGEEVNLRVADTSLGIGEPAWSLVDSAYESIASENTNIEVDPNTGTITIRDSLNVVDPFKDIVVIQGGIDPELTPVHQTRQIARKPTTIDDQKAALTPIPDPVDEVFTITGNNEGVFVNHAVDNRYSPTLKSQNLAVLVDDEEVMHLYFTKRNEQWSVSRLTSLNDNVLPLSMVHTVKGDNISISQYALIMAMLKRKDIFGASNVKIKYLGITNDDQYVYLERTHDVSPERAVGNNMPLNPRLADGNTPESAQRRLLQLGVATRVNANEETIAPQRAVAPFIPMNKNAFADFRNQRSFVSQSEKDYDAAMNIGVIGSNGFSITSIQGGLNMAHEMMLKPTKNSDGTYNPFVIVGDYYTSTSEFSMISRKPVVVGDELCKLYGMDKAVFAIRDKDGKMQLLSLRLERERLKVKDAPVGYYFYNAEGNSVTIDGKAYQHDDMMLPAPASVVDRVLADDYSPPSTMPKQLVMARKFNKTFGDMYLDELVEDEQLKFMLARFKWVEDVETTSDKMKMFRYGTSDTSRTTGMVGRTEIEADIGYNAQTHYHAWFQPSFIKRPNGQLNAPGNLYYSYLAQTPSETYPKTVANSRHILDTSIYNTHLKTFDFTDGEQKLKVTVGAYTTAHFPTAGSSMAQYYGKVRKRGADDTSSTFDYVANGVTNNADVLTGFTNTNQAWFKYDTRSFNMIESIDRVYFNLLEAKRSTIMTNAYKPYMRGVNESDRALPVPEEITRVYILTHHNGGWLFEAFDYFLNESMYDTTREMKTNYGFNM